MPSPSTLVVGLLVCAVLIHAVSSAICGSSGAPGAAAAVGPRGRPRPIGFAAEDSDDALELLERATPKKSKSKKSFKSSSGKERNEPKAKRKGIER